MKDSIEQDQRVSRELANYQLAAPSADLQDRVLRAAREAWADTDAESRWTDRWLRTYGSFRQEILAFSSALLVIVGIVLQFGGGQSVLADSIERLKVMVTVSGCLHRARSMDCTVLKPGAADRDSQYRVRWNTSGVTRIDMASDATKQTLWSSDGTFSVIDREGGEARSTAITDIPSEWQPAAEFLTPAVLARHMEEQMESERRGGAGPDEFLIIGRGGRQDVEITIDAKTYLPKVLRKYSHAGDLKHSARICTIEARFIWNQPIPAELFSRGLRQQGNRSMSCAVQP